MIGKVLNEVYGIKNPDKKEGDDKETDDSNLNNLAHHYSEHPSFGFFKAP